MKSRYNAEIVAGALLPHESRIIARLELDKTSPDELMRLLVQENILQKRSPRTAIRKSKLIAKRFSTLDRSMLTLIAEGNLQVVNQALLVGAIKHSMLIGDFLQRVVKEKWRIFETNLNRSDWDDFLVECEGIDETVGKWKQSTRAKLGQVVKKCLVEAGYLENSSNLRITPVALFPEIRQYLIEKKENYVLDCMDIFS